MQASVASIRFASAASVEFLAGPSGMGTKTLYKMPTTMAPANVVKNADRIAQARGGRRELGNGAQERGLPENPLRFVEQAGEEVVDRAAQAEEAVAPPENTLGWLHA
jgi:hypothetical protein